MANPTPIAQQEHKTITDRNFSLGMDQRSAEGEIQPGYVEDAVNIDIVQGRLRKRNGYAPYAQLPVSISEFSYQTTGGITSIYVNFPLSVDLSTTPKCPVILAGTLPASPTNGDFSTTYASNYYSSATPVLAFTLAAGTNLTHTIESAAVPFDSFKFSVRFAANNGTGNEAYELNSVIVDSTTFAISLNYTSASMIESFVYFADRSLNSYIKQTAVNTNTFTIPASTHNLDTAQLLIEVWKHNSDDTTYERVEEVGATVDLSTGDVSITLEQNTPAPMPDTNYTTIITALPAANMLTETLGGVSTLTLTIPDASTPYLFSACYYTESITGLLATTCYPDSVVYDRATNSHILVFTNIDSSKYGIRVFYDYGFIVSNKLLVGTNKGGVVANATYYPQMCIYGLLNELVFPDEQAGIAQHIDSYRKEGSNRIVASLGGNLFGVYDKTEIAYPSVFPSLQARANSDFVLGPAFMSSAPPPVQQRTGGYIVSADADGSNCLPCISAAWQNNSNVLFTLQATSLSKTGDPIKEGDLLSVSNASWDVLNGEHPVVSVSHTADTILVVCNVAAIFNDDYDAENMTALAGLYSNWIDVGDASQLLPGDVIAGGSLTAAYPTIASIVKGSGSDSICLTGIASFIEVAAALKITATRTTALIPCRDNLGNQSVGEIVGGDVVLSDKYVVGVNAQADQACSIVNDIVTVANSSYWKPGDLIQLARIGIYTIADILSSTTFSLTSIPNIASATIVGYTLQIHKEVEVADTTHVSLDVERRAIQLVAPTSSAVSIASQIATSYFPSTPITGQLQIKSTIVANNMYLTNGVDPVMKYDGQYLYQASLPAWNPMLYCRFVADASGSFGLPSKNEDVTGYIDPAVSKSTFLVEGAQVGGADKYQPGDMVRITSGANYLDTSIRSVTKAVGTITAHAFVVNASGADTVALIQLDDVATFVGASVVACTLQRRFVYKYYYRLNHVDGNNNVIASAAVGFDTAITQVTNGAVVHKLVQPPAYGLYDYSHIEIQIYRTKGNGNIYYLVGSVPASFKKVDPYVLTSKTDNTAVVFTDTYGDIDLQQLDPTSILLNGEVGTTFHGAPIAKYITSTGNSLILSDITSEPRLSVVVDSIGVPLLADFDTLSFTLAGPTTHVYKCTTAYTASSSLVSIVVASGYFTITKNGHGFKVGDWVYIFQDTLADDALLRPFTGYWQIAEVGTNTFTIKCASITASTPVPAATLPAYCGFTGGVNIVPIFLDSGNKDLSRGPGSMSSIEPLVRVTNRLMQAINISMRALDTTISGQETFVPWLLASTSNTNELLLSSPSNNTFTMVFPALATNAANYNWWANGSHWLSGSAGSITLRLPSRLVYSYPNYPEIFDSIYTVDPKDSDSAVDINPSDGQEITGALPFFGDTAFGAALKGSYLLAFKENSVYVIDNTAKAQHLEPVQRLETNGVGCSAPRSIAPSNNAIFFASVAGIYAIRRNLTVEYIGKFIERQYLENTNYALLPTIACGHHDPIGKKYKLSYPGLTSNLNDSVLAYNHSQEDEGHVGASSAFYTYWGAWTRYTNHFVSGWANLNADEFFATTKGWVAKTRRTYTSADFSDAGEAITATVVFRANHFGDTGNRKQVRHVIAHYRPITSLTNIKIYSAIDLSDSWTLLDGYQVIKPNDSTDLNDLTGGRVRVLAHSLSQERGMYFQMKIEDSGLEEGLDFIGLDYLVLLLSHHGIQDALTTLS